MAPTFDNVGNHIPYDLCLGILYKLPLKSLKRFCCVCKSWADLFESPEFEAMYHNNLFSSHHTDNSSILLKQKSHLTDCDSLFLLFGKRLENKVNIDFPIFNYININILGTFVNDTLCLYESTTFDNTFLNIPFKAVLWNSTTEQFKVVRPGIIGDPRDLRIRLYGFGYDPVTYDYKLIRHIQFFNKNWAGKVLLLTQIYSLRHDSWRDLDVEMPTYDCHSQVYCNGMCHWLGLKVENLERVLVSFNLSDEVLHTTTLDCSCRDRFAYEDWKRSALVVLNDSIAIIRWSARNACFDVSILGAIGVKESWAKLFSIRHLPNGSVPIGVWKKGFLFYTKEFNGKLAYFNSSTQVIEEFDIEQDGSKSQIVICKESIGANARLNQFF